MTAVGGDIVISGKVVTANFSALTSVGGTATFRATEQLAPVVGLPPELEPAGPHIVLTAPSVNVYSIFPGTARASFVCAANLSVTLIYGCDTRRVASCTLQRLPKRPRCRRARSS